MMVIRQHNKVLPNNLGFCPIHELNLKDYTKNLESGA